MPAIPIHHGQAGPVALQARDWRDTVGQSGITPTAFAFLVPVFVVAVAAPFLCIFCIRKRRQEQPAAAPRARKPALRRAEARDRLGAVTQVSNLTDQLTSARDGTSEQQTGRAEARSVLERECAICLSTLYAPSPPEEAKLSDRPVVDSAVEPSSPKDAAAATPEQILKLHVCGHEFHADCLVSWLVLRKTSCPICRAVYLSKEDMQSLDNEAQPPVLTPSAVQAETPIPVGNWRYFVHGHSVFSGRSGNGPQQPSQPSTQLQRLTTHG